MINLWNKTKQLANITVAKSKKATVESSASTTDATDKQLNTTDIHKMPSTLDHFERSLFEHLNSEYGTVADRLRQDILYPRD